MIFTVFKWGDKKAKKHALKTKQKNEKLWLTNYICIYLLLLADDVFAK